MKDKIAFLLALSVGAGIFWWGASAADPASYRHPKLGAFVRQHPTAAHDDSNTAHQISKPGATFLSDLQTFLGTESASRFTEEGLVNFVDNFSSNSISTACLGATGAGLTMTPGACIAYNAGLRSTCGVGNNLGLGPLGTVPSSTTSDCPGGNSITFADNSTCWVAMDENTTGNNSGIATFTRVTGTHYLTDCASVTQPAMATDSQLLMKVVTSAGSITAVTDLRNVSPFQTAGIINPVSFGAKCDGATDDAVAIQRVLDVAKNGGTGALTSKQVQFPAGVKCDFSTTLDFKGVPVRCGGTSPIGSGTKSTTILNFTGTSGNAIIHAGDFRDCEVDGGFALGAGLSATISAISETGNTVTVTLTGAPANPIVQGSGVVISGTTNYNGVWRAATAPSTSSFTFQDGNASLGAEAAGTVNFYPTVGIQHLTESGSISCCDVNWQNLVVTGFGVGIDLSASQVIAGSTNDWNIGGRNTIRNTIIGVQALGNAVPLGGSPLANVAAGAITGTLQITNTAIGVNCGPAHTDQESGCALNKWQHIDFEAANTHSSDSAIVAPIIASSYGNEISNNYISSSVGAGQTLSALIDTTGGFGTNSIHDNLLSGTIASQWKGVGADFAYNNTLGGTRAQQLVGAPISGGISTTKVGTTKAPYSVLTHGTTGGAAVQYALVCHDWEYSGSGVSDGTALPSSFVSTGGAGSGPAAFSGTNYVTVCWQPDPRCKCYDILNADTSHAATGGLCYVPGTNGNNCFPDTAGTTIGYTAPGSDTTGSVKLATPMDVSNWAGVALLTQGGTGTAGQYPLASSAGVLGLLSYANEVLFDAPGGYWKLNETSGNFSDSSGNSNTATAVGGISYSVAGAIVDGDTAITLNGTTGAATVATAASLPSGDIFTVEGWLKRADSGVSEMLVSQKANGFEVYLSGGNTLVLRKSGVADILHSTNTITDTTTWHQFAATKTGTNAHVYIDGVDVSFVVVNQTIAPADASLFIGKNNAAGQFFNGSLDEIAVYPTALSAARIAAHYLEGLSKKKGRIGYATDVNCEANYINGAWVPTNCGITTVGALPDCTKLQGAWATVTDHNAGCAYGATPTAGANDVCPVFCNGTAWLVH